MTPELKAKWVEALRSGKYKQGTGRLLRAGRDGYKHCCLGVLCEVAGYQRGEGDVYLDKQSIPLTYSLDDHTDLILGITPSVESFLIRMNDGGLTFAEIANHIEKCVPVDES